MVGGSTVGIIEVKLRMHRKRTEATRPREAKSLSIVALKKANGRYRLQIEFSIPDNTEVGAMSPIRLHVGDADLDALGALPTGSKSEIPQLRAVGEATPKIATKEAFDRLRDESAATELVPLAPVVAQGVAELTIDDFHRKYFVPGDRPGWPPGWSGKAKSGTRHGLCVSFPLGTR